MPSTSELDARREDGPAALKPALVLDDVWLRFQLRYYKKRNTLRGAIVGGVSSVLSFRRDRVEEGDFWALRGVNLTISEGEVVGVIGHNGAGKSTLLRVMAGIYGADRGQVLSNGTISTLLSLGAGFDLRRPGRENIYKNGILLGLRPDQINERMDAIIDMSGLDEFIDAPVMTYSSGMRARLGFSIAVNVNPDILLVDEVVGAGDERFRKRVGNIFDQLSHNQKTVVLVTHQVALLGQYCTRGVWMERGKVRLDGAPNEVAEAYLESARAES